MPEAEETFTCGTRAKAVTMDSWGASCLFEIKKQMMPEAEETFTRGTRAKAVGSTTARQRSATAKEGEGKAKA